MNRLRMAGPLQIPLGDGRTHRGSMVCFGILPEITKDVACLAFAQLLI